MPGLDPWRPQFRLLRWCAARRSRDTSLPRYTGRGRVGILVKPVEAAADLNDRARQPQDPMSGLRPACPRSPGAGLFSFARLQPPIVAGIGHQMGKLSQGASVVGVWFQDIFDGLFSGDA